MAQYKISGDGILDTITNQHFVADSENTAAKRFRRWVKGLDEDSIAALPAAARDLLEQKLKAKHFAFLRSAIPNEQETDAEIQATVDAAGPDRRDPFIDELDDADRIDIGCIAQTPDAEFTQVELDANADAAETATLCGDLSGAMIDLFRMILEVFQVGQDKGIWIKADFDPDLVTKAQTWKQKVDRLKQLGQ